jgi:tRNA threonylcarbamoyladenosine biosynthesis protein TsaE
MELTYSLGEIREAAREFWKTFSGRRVFAFHGPMGAGKTTFIHALCEEKAVQDVVSSPTFSLVNEYIYRDGKVERGIYHIDLYRVSDAEEAIRAGVEDCLYSDHTCFVEWPERAPSILPPGTLHVRFEVLDTTRRRLKINGN